MKKFTSKQVVETFGEFSVPGKKGEIYAFVFNTLIYEESKDWAWCLARPKYIDKSIMGENEVVLFKITYNIDPKNSELVQIDFIPDIDLMNEVVDAYNETMDEEEMSANLKNKE